MKTTSTLQRKTPMKRGTSQLKRSYFKRTVTKASKKRRKKGEWSTHTADKYFSQYIRERDEKCLKCGTKDNLTCSHYFRRGHSATRFDPENCIALCQLCHSEWEGPKEPYTQLMIAMLGQEKFLALTLKAGRYTKRSEAVAEFKAFYQSWRQ